MGKSTVKTAFRIEGRFLEFILKDGYKIKALRLATAAGECTIKLPKELRASLHRVLMPGEWICVTGVQTFDRKKETIKLAAEAIAPASPGVPEARPEAQPENQVDPSHLMPTQSGVAPECAFEGESRGDLGAIANPARPVSILVCKKSDCCKRGGRAVSAALETALSERQLGDRVTIRPTGCMKRCKAGPNLVMPDKTRYTRVRPEEIPSLIDQHFHAQRFHA